VSAALRHGITDNSVIAKSRESINSPLRDSLKETRVT
jgi:hypothetical protein